MLENAIDGQQAPTSGNRKPDQPSPAAGRILQILNERRGSLPVWVRAPVQGTEFFSGQSRAKLYQLDAAGLIKSASLREPGAVKGVRVFNLESILAYIESKVRAQ